MLVLDARATAGGGAATEELTLPGFRFDTCSTGHTLIQPNPVLRDDELGLKSVYGLEYVSPDPVAHVVFPDGESFTHWLDLDRTLEEIARFSSRDANTYRRGLDDFAAIRGALGAYRFNPIGYAPPLDVALADRPRWLRRIAMSAYDVVRHEYESRHVRAYLLWQAFQTAQAVDSPGSGLLAYSIVAGRQAQSWTLPLGGSGELPRALLDCLADHGATVALRPARHRARARGRPLHGRRHRGRRALPRPPGGPLDDPRQAARRDGPGRGVGRRLPRRGRHLRRRHLLVRAVLRDDRGARAARAGRDPDRGLGRCRRLARGRAPGGARRPRGQAPARALAADRDADARRPLARARGAPHGQAAEHGAVERRRLGRAEAPRSRRRTSRRCAGPRRT